MSTSDSCFLCCVDGLLLDLVLYHGFRTFPVGLYLDKLLQWDERGTYKTSFEFILLDR